MSDHSKSGPHSPIAGEVAIEIARQIADPMRGLRDRLALVVDHLERHVANSTGPSPYPWRSLQTLRQDLAAAYLEATSLARRLDELDRALDEEPPGWFELSSAVELGLRLAGHHLGPDIELMIDLAAPTAVRGSSGSLALLVAELVAISAASARALTGSTLSVRVTIEEGWAVVQIADNGAGNARATAVGDMVRAVMLPWGATNDAASEDGQGTSFELRLITAPA